MAEEEGKDGGQGSAELAYDPDVDWLLQNLVAVVNRGLIVYITLTVGGAMISGEAISRVKYFEELREAFRDGRDQEDPNVMDEWVRIHASNFAVDLEEGAEAAEARSRMSPPGFIHLRNARLYQTSALPIPSSGGVLWRGRLSAIDGFHLGRLGHSVE